MNTLNEINQNNPQTSSLHRFIDIMLRYWDPWSLIHGAWAPDDEYKSYIDRVVMLAQSTPFNPKVFSDGLYVLFLVDGMPSLNLKRAIEGMTEGVEYYHSINKQ